VVDIPNAFVQTRVENKKDMAFIKISGVLVDILVEIAPDVYKSYVSGDKKGMKQLLVQCHNALYGTLAASLFYYRQFVKSLEGKKMTICFHVDDCKLNHRKKKVMDTMIEYLREEYESILENGTGAMMVSRGNIHKCLGMILDYTVCGQVKTTIFDYVDEILTAFDKAEPKGGGTKTSTAPDSLFKGDDSCVKLAQNKAVVFHNLVSKQLFATKRAGPYTCTAITF
jgi:hypothetical protein